LEGKDKWGGRVQLTLLDEKKDQPPRFPSRELGNTQTPNHRTTKTNQQTKIMKGGGPKVHLMDQRGGGGKRGWGWGVRIGEKPKNCGIHYNLQNERKTKG